MQVIHERCAALDIGKSVVVACVRRPHCGGGRQQQVRTFEAFVDALERLRNWLVAERVTHVAMEATGSYWRPVWYVLDDAGFDLLLVNARQRQAGAGPQDRRQRRRMAGRAARVRAVGRLVRAAAGDPRAA